MVKDKYDVPVVSTGDFVREEALRRGFSLTVENITQVSNQIRTENNGIFMRALLRDIDRALDTRGIVLIDCLREASDYDELVKRSGEGTVTVIALSSSDTNRYHRITSRMRESGPMSEDEFKKLTEFETRLGVDTLIQIADYKITNDSSETDFKSAASDLLLRMGKEKGVLLRR